MRALFVANPNSGPRRAGRLPIQDRLQEALRGCGFETEIVLTRAPGHAIALAREGVAAGYPLVVAVGGDGTANEVASALAHGECALGVVPIGSGNGFARDFGVSLDIGRACRQLVAARTLRIDLGQADDRYFLMGAGFGLDARVAHRFHQEAGGSRGLLPYITLSLGEMRSYVPPTLSLEVGGQTHVLRAWVLSAANTRQLGGGAILAPSARGDDGMLDFVLLPPLGLGRALVYGARLFSGSFDRGSRVSILRAQEATLSGAAPIEGQVDGEPARFGERVRLRCIAGALSFRAPA